MTALEFHAVVRPRCPLMVLTQDVRQVAPNPRDKSCPFFTRRHLKLRVVAREEFLPDEPVRRFQARDPAKRPSLSFRA